MSDLHVLLVIVTRLGKRILLLTAALWAVFGTAGAAHAADGIITVTGYAKCSSAGVSVFNDSGETIEVRLYLDGNPAFDGNPWISIATGQSKLISGVAPASGSGVYQTNVKNTVDLEVPLATTTYARPDYCDNFKITYTDTCDKVTVTVKNNHGSNVTFTLAQTSGATYPIATLAVANGETNSVDIPITAAIKRIGLYLDSEGDYVDQYTPKGLGNCETPTPSASSGGGGLPVTGSGNLSSLLLVGFGFVLAGAIAIAAVRRSRGQIQE